MASDRLWEHRKERLVVLDSNAVLMLFECSINLESELLRLLGSFHIVVPDFVVKELNILFEKSRGKKKVNAKAGLSLIKNYDVVDFDTDKNCDDALLDFAFSNGAIVVTNDKELRRRFKDRSLKTICLRGKNHLMIS